MIEKIKGDFAKSIGMIVGGSVDAGIFGAPFVFAQSGFLLASLLILFLGVFAAILHLMLLDIGDRTPGKHRLVGLSGLYLGRVGKIVATGSVVFGGIGALVVYILVAGTFLSVLFGGFGAGDTILMGAFWAIMSAVMFWGLRIAIWLEMVMAAGMVLILLFFIIQGAPHIDYNNFLTINFDKTFLAWGVLLFALFRPPAISESRAATGLRGRAIRKAALFGTSISLIMILLFSVIVVGVTGANSSQEAISGLVNYLGEGTVKAGAIMGLLAISSSFLVLGFNIRDTFMYDLNVSKKKGDIFVIFACLAFLFFGFSDIITLMGLLGVILGVINGCFIILIFIKAKNKYPKIYEGSLNLSPFMYPVLVIVLALGGIYSVFEIIS